MKNFTSSGHYKKNKKVCRFNGKLGDKHNMRQKNNKGGDMQLSKNLKWVKWLTSKYGFCYIEGEGFHLIINNKTWVKGIKVL